MKKKFYILIYHLLANWKATFVKAIAKDHLIDLYSPRCCAIFSFIEKRKRNVNLNLTTSRTAVLVLRLFNLIIQEPKHKQHECHPITINSFAFLTRSLNTNRTFSLLREVLCGRMAPRMSSNLSNHWLFWFDLMWRISIEKILLLNTLASYKMQCCRKIDSRCPELRPSSLDR